MLCYAMLCYAMLCYAMLCYAMLCYCFARPKATMYAVIPDWYKDSPCSIVANITLLEHPQENLGICQTLLSEREIHAMYTVASLYM